MGLSRLAFSRPSAPCIKSVVDMELQSSSEPRRIYLDNAATAWPKCAAALDAAERFARDCGATSGRGAYKSAMLADRWLEDARSNLARLLGADDGRSVAICTSGTHALNAALWGVLNPGDHVITTGMDHNSLLRPLKNLETHFGVQVSIADSDGYGFADPRQAEIHVREHTRLLAVGHASNVTGKVQDIEGWSQLARSLGAKLLVDASQTVGYLPIDMQASRIDLLAAAGHKGLRALQGTGLLVASPEARQAFRPLMLGGTGHASESLEIRQAWPQCVEVGNLNMPGVVSLAIAAKELLENQDLQCKAWQSRFQQLVVGLSRIRGLSLVGYDDEEAVQARIPVVSLQADGWNVHDLASVLDTSFGIEVRAGWHCAALVHDALGTSQSGGTLRLSPSVSTTAEEIEYTLAAFREILGS